jgi:hypothetical protein
LPNAVEISLPSVAWSDIPATPTKAGPSIIGVHRTLEQAAIPVEQGWQVIPDGRTVWRMAIRSSQALAMRLHFTGFSVGEGRVWIYSSQGEPDAVAGPYTGQGIFGDGDFWAHTVTGETVVVEYAPAPSSEQTSVPFGISEISHVWSDLAQTSGGAPETPTSKPGSVEQAAPCHFDVTCSPAWEGPSRAVAQIVYEEGGASWVCSGSLLNTRSANLSPYFLTANHCIDNDTAARTLEAFWFYQTSSCNGDEPIKDLAPKTMGARYLMGRGWAEGDFSLLLLLAQPPSGVCFAGWDPNEKPVGSGLVGIHHPDGSYKRISFGTRVADAAAFLVDGSYAPADQFY